MKIAKRIALVLILVALPVIWVYMTMERPHKPPPPPPPPKTEKTPTPSTLPARPSRPPMPGRQAVLETAKGKIVIALYEKDAPTTCKNFIALADRKFYDGLTFHRVEPGFVIQTGDPTASGSGGSGKTIPLEIASNLRHSAEGTVGMARTNDPNSATSQFYITLSATPQLDDQYAVFGRVVSGMDVVKKIAVGDKVKRLRVLPIDKPAVRVYTPT